MVFTLPHALNALAQGNPRVIYRLLFRAAADTLFAFGRDPQYLGGTIGITAILHTWGQTLTQHLHLHCLVTGGVLASDGSRWIAGRSSFLCPVRALSRVFRAKALEQLQRALDAGHLTFAGGTADLAHPATAARFLQALRATDWVVYAKRPFAGPDQILAYLGRYLRRPATRGALRATPDHRSVSVRQRPFAAATPAPPRAWNSSPRHPRAPQAPVRSLPLPCRFLRPTPDSALQSPVPIGTLTHAVQFNYKLG